MKHLAPLLICLIVLIGTSGCWINLNAESQPTAVAQDLPTLTPTFTETFTPSPEPVETEEPTLEVETEEVFVETEEPTVTETPEGVTQVAQIDPEPTEDLSEELPGEIDPFILAATDLVATSTQEILDITLTAQAVFQLETPSLTPDFIETVDTPTFTPDTGSGIPPVTGGDCVHQVVAGDNMFRIGLRYGVPLADLANRNGITNVNFISVGQRITIPGCGTTGQFPPATTEGSSDPVVNPGGGTGNNTCGPQVVVDQGDTLFQISLRCNVPVRTIASNNGIQNINLIYIDQVLNLP